VKQGPHLPAPACNENVGITATSTSICHHQLYDAMVSHLSRLPPALLRCIALHLKPAPCYLRAFNSAAMRGVRSTQHRAADSSTQYWRQEYERLQPQNERLLRQLEEVTNTNLQLMARLDDFSAKDIARDAETKQLRAETKQLQAKDIARDAETKQLRAEIEQLQAKDIARDAEIKQLRADNTDLRTQIERLQADNTVLRAQVDLMGRLLVRGVDAACTLEDAYAALIAFGLLHQCGRVEAQPQEVLRRLQASRPLPKPSPWADGLSETDLAWFREEPLCRGIDAVCALTARQAFQRLLQFFASDIREDCDTTAHARSLACAIGMAHLALSQADAAQKWLDFREIWLELTGMDLRETREVPSWLSDLTRDGPHVAPAPLKAFAACASLTALQSPVNTAERI
jgi:hypothetical protein